MGRIWGKIGYVRWKTSYTLSPYEQKVFHGVISKGINRTAGRVYSQFFKVLPPFIAAYMVISWCEQENARVSRKNPADFANDS
ncbi:cytochrome b-c1 complex subunit 8-like [Watersipora subatra]|uniref:cytochrome b-c1 complex subunit 8-like n=1 Tax=Watersipora subatra TaxID=2589382 RepID=UPI00355BBC74